MDAIEQLDGNCTYSSSSESEADGVDMEDQDDSEIESNGDSSDSEDDMYVGIANLFAPVESKFNKVEM